MSAIRGVLAFAIALLGVPAFWPTAAIATLPAEPTPPASALLRAAPPLFVENIGQFPPVVRFQARGGGGAWWFADDGIWLAVAGAADGAAAPALARLHLTFAGAAPTAPRPVGVPAARVSYLLGSDPAGWHAGAPAWTGVRYDNLYPGLDLVIGDGGAGQVRWWWEARDGADPATARLTIAGGDVQSVDEGLLRIATGAGDVALPLPSAATLSAPARLVAGEVVGPVGMGSAPTDALQAAAVNDLLYATFLGDTGDDQATGVAVDAGGNAYVTGYTSSVDFSSLPASYDPLLSENGTGQDAFVVKLNATGSTLAYWTYLGGSSADTGAAIAVNVAGEAYVTGMTKSNAANGGFPTTDNAYQKPPQAGNESVFVAVLDAEGASLLYSTLLAGAGQDLPGNIAVGPDGQAYVAGATSSTDFPAKGGISKPGNYDVFVAKLNPASTSGPTSLVYATFIGASQKDRNGVVAVDGTGAAYVAGVTEGNAFNSVTRPIGLPGPFDKSYNGGFTDAFVAKLNPQGERVYATLLGGSDEDAATAIAVDAAGTNVYVTGYTNSHAGLSVPFPKAAGAYGGGACPVPPAATRGCFDVFVARLTLAATGTNDLIAAALIGGAGDDTGTGIAVDSVGRIYVTGETASAAFPTTTNGYQTGPQGARDAFALKLDAAISSIRYSTYLGGGADDFGRSIALSGNTPYVAGGTVSGNFPTRSGGYQTTPGGGAAGFVTKWAMPEDNPRALAGPPATATPTATTGPGQPTATATTAPGQPTATATQPAAPATPTPLPTVIGTTATAKTWYFAEGYTGPGFDEYLTINNPGVVNGSATITYFVEGETTPTQRVVALPRNSRTTITVHGDWHPTSNPGGLGR
ncbi:MAG: SBBP repeat-containing protein, partial [Chloroflexi bacterium]|nr:SBBP repeat-containing protein [Chloroflexota bacterium]